MASQSYSWDLGHLVQDDAPGRGAALPGPGARNRAERTEVPGPGGSGAHRDRLRPVPPVTAARCP